MGIRKTYPPETKEMAIKMYFDDEKTISWYS